MNTQKMSGKEKLVNKLVIYFKPSRGFDNISRKMGLELVIEGIRETFETWGFKYEIIEDDKFKILSIDWTDENVREHEEKEEKKK